MWTALQFSDLNSATRGVRNESPTKRCSEVSLFVYIKGFDKMNRISDRKIYTFQCLKCDKWGKNVYCAILSQWTGNIKISKLLLFRKNSEPLINADIPSCTCRCLHVSYQIDWHNKICFTELRASKKVLNVVSFSTFYLFLKESVSNIKSCGVNLRAGS